MKHLLFAFALLFSLSAFSQAKPIKNHLPVPGVSIKQQGNDIVIQSGNPAPVQASSDQYVIMLSYGDLTQLYQLIENADFFTDKGREAYLKNVLKPKVFLLPKDTTKGK